MQIRYDVVDKPIKCDKVSSEAALLFISGNRNIFEAIKCILFNLFKIDSFSLELLHEEFFYNVVMSLTFLAKTKYGDFTIVLNDNNIKVDNDEASYSFQLEKFSSGDQIALKEIKVFQKDKVIIERFNTHKMELEIHFKNNGKVLFMQMPIDMETVFNIENLDILKEDATISDLRAFYRNMFYHMQGTYDREGCITVISVWQKLLSYGDISVKGIKLDELGLQNDYIQNYQLGNIYMIKNEGPIIVILDNGVFTIGGFENYESCDLDFNETMIRLLKQKEQLD